MIVNVVYGFLGAGKTTFIRYMMERPPAGEKVVILVNEFGEIGIDGLILSGHGGQVAEVVELPSGCICCTIASDFRRQVRDLYERFNPDRMIIEPTGVATITQIMQILEGEDLSPLYSALVLIHILDGSEFLSFVKSHRHFMENQIRRSGVVLLNKMDQVKGHLLDLLVESIREINPDVRVYPTSFTRLDPTILHEILHATEAGPGRDEEDHGEEAVHEHGHEHAHEHDHGLADHYQSFSKVYRGIFNRKRLESFFDDLNSRRYGEVVRAKGIFKTSGNWVKLELASGRVQIGPGPEVSDSAVSIIGSDMKLAEMENKLSNCRAD